MRHSTRLGRRLAPSALVAMLTLALTLPASAAIITVDSGTDDGVGCTLREAVASANMDAAIGGCAAGDDADDEIRFTVSSVTLTSGQLVIQEALIVTGPVTINAAPASRIFDVPFDEPVAFTDVTFQGGRGDGGALRVFGGADVTVTGGAATLNNAPGSGGAFWVSALGSLTVTGTAFTGNQARGGAATEGGGAIYTQGGDLSVADATFTDNRALGAAGSGGAILNPNGATLTVTNSTFSQNRSQRAGGAIETVGGTTDVSGTTFEFNTAGSAPGNGGAIHGGGDVTLTVSDGTATGNRATEGGAYWISGAGTLSVFGGSISGNLAEGPAADNGGGGLYSDGGTLVVADGVDSSVSITGNRATGAAGSGGGILIAGGTATITNAVLEANRAQRAGGAIEIVDGDVTITGGVFTQNVVATAPGNGGAIHTTSPSGATLDISDSAFSNNEAGAEGGGLWINANTTLTLSTSQVFGNAARGTAADNGGGGVFNNGGDATISTTTIANNRTFGQGVPGGGVLAVGGTTTISQSAIVNNTSNLGGGLAALPGATVDVENTTVYGNAARYGGGVFSQEGTIAFDSATIAENTAETGGGGLYNQNPPNQGVPFVTLANTIVADNAAPATPNLSGRYASGGWNVIGTTPPASTFPAQPSDQLGTDPLLGPLADNGGPTDTAALLSGSPAIDAGSTALAVDQRGVARTEPDDVGAVEFGDADAGGDPTMALVLTGVVDGPLPGGLPKAAEIYVAQDVADLSLYAIGSANNGGGTDGPEFYLTGSASAGAYLYVASEAPGFTEFFGFAPDFTSGALSVNGDDAVELFYDDDGSGGGNAAVVVDTFGDVDATSGGWLYNDGWAYRTDGTGPDGGTFVEGNFTYSGVDALDGETSNATAATPWPIGTYSPDADDADALAAPAAALAETMAEAVRLGAVTPNPVGSRATVGFAVREAQPVTVGLYDVMGRRVRTLFAGTPQAEAAVAVPIDASGLAAGVYVVVLQGETVRATRQVTVVR